MRFPFLERSPASHLAAPHTPSVLLVEDEQAQRWLFGNALRQAGYDVIEAADGEQALKACRGTESLDLLITDIRMPVMTGVELAAKLRERFPAVPVLFVTGYDVVGILGLDMFPAHVLQKPFTRVRLLDHVHQVLQWDESDGTV